MSLLSGRSRPFLPDPDYLPVAMPSTDIEVLQVLASGGRTTLRRYSTLGNVLVSDAPLPTVQRDSPTVDADGSTRTSARVGIGLGLVGQILQAFGAEAKLDLSAGRAHTVEFSYADVTFDVVDLAELDKWLSGADFDPAARGTSELLAAEEMYVVVAVLKARALTVRLVAEDSAAVAVNVPALAAAVDGELEVSATAAADGTVKFRGRTALGVAVKATPIQIDEQGFYLGRTPRLRGEVRPIGRRYEWLAGAPMRWQEP